MSAARPEIAARRLLAQWLSEEVLLHRALQNEVPEAQRSAIGRAVTQFRVVRSLRRSAEEALGVPRFESVRECLTAVKGRDVTAETFVSVTTDFAQAVARRYGGHSFLSLASKLLWLRFRDPFVIYDSIVLSALGTRVADYPGYVVAWNERYARHEAAIARACAGLSDSHQVANEEWFRRRVLDVMLLGDA